MTNLNELASRVEAARGPDRELDAEIMFDLFAKPVGKHEMDGGPTGYLWPEDDASWAFGHRFPGKDRKWFADVRHRKGAPRSCPECGHGFDRETLVIERDGALVLMNELRVPNLTASLDAAMTLVPEGWIATIGAGLGIGTAALSAEHASGAFVGAKAATPALALSAAALRARAAGEE